MNQMSLSFEPGISQRYRSLVECVAAGVYHRGLGRVASLVDEAPSHLSAQLSGDGRRLAAETLEDYIAKTGDLQPIYYLIDKFLRDEKLRRQEALERAADMLPEVIAALNAAGYAVKGRK